MDTKFSVAVTQFKTISQLPNAWSEKDYKNILELCDFDDVNSIDISELHDYMVMSLQDLKPHEASTVWAVY